MGTISCAVTSLYCKENTEVGQQQPETPVSWRQGSPSLEAFPLSSQMIHDAFLAEEYPPAVPNVHFPNAAKSSP